MRKRLTQKQETFCLKYFELGNASEAARLAKYSPKTAAVIGRENLLKPNIQARITELRQKTEDESVMNVLERKQRLTEIGRARLTDFMELGQDGSWVNIGEETPRGGAIQEIDRFTEIVNQVLCQVIRREQVQVEIVLVDARQQDGDPKMARDLFL